MQDLEEMRSVTLRVSDRRGLHLDIRWAWVLQGQGFILDKYNGGKDAQVRGQVYGPVLRSALLRISGWFCVDLRHNVFKHRSAHPKAKLLSHLVVEM